MKKYLLYAAYGSNLLKKRLLAYIEGKDFKGRKHNGCSDRTSPEDYGWMYVPHRLYFAKNSSRWGNGGVAFLSCGRTDNPEMHAIVRLWKISEIQFYEINQQEGKGWYNKILSFGEKDGLEIKTFTGCWENSVNQPTEEYLDCIIKGIRETTGWDDERIKNYINNFLK
ncbi:hypothetical protein [Thermodesulfovibrio yellowstonii]|uniref:Gamma-glutamylcyclotransferase n=1 Tax=Thermodesulfovibrio yellowstonii TaxID=28262 RepID=A0A9W6GI12_9BACT|nr:hypothetical protein [Thermodesulfovibrio islandicus]GLI54478.1 hypothetical protein TISLANDTSLP1_21710 [Thermodesulfovibrio islandicus]